MTLRWILEKGTTSEKTVKQVQDRLGVVFLEAYIDFILLHPGGRPRPNSTQLPKGRQITIKSLLPLEATRQGNVLQVLEWLSDRLPPKLVPVVDDNFGNYFCLDYRQEGKPSVVFWDHEVLNSPGAYVSNTFEEFLSSLIMEE